MRITTRFIIFLLLASCLPACQQQVVYTPPPEWKYADLRALDAADNIPASQDLVALYVRRLGEDVEVRLDFLDITTAQDYDIRLQIVSTVREVVTIVIPASGPITVDSQSGLIPDARPRILRDTFLDTVVISVNRASLFHNNLPFIVTAYSSAPELSATLGGTSGDQIGPVRSDAMPPPRVEVLFSFWDTFTAATPAQALRAWDGAHSGPGRSRFGLAHLLNAVKIYHVPVFLLDLRTPTTLSVLDYMGVLPEVQSLADRQLIILPGVARNHLSAAVTSFIPEANKDQLPSTPFLYAAALTSPSDDHYQVLFLSSDTSGTDPIPLSTYRWQDKTIIPIPDDRPDTHADAPTGAGPSLPLRRELATFASTSFPDIFFLGGVFAYSAWGDPACVGPTLRYLIAHPWIHFLSPDNLLTLQVSRAFPGEWSFTQPGSNLADQILSALLNAPSNPITDQAWQSYLSLLTPASPELVNLRAGYFGIVGHLLTAARWAAHPGNTTDCSVDIDWDSQPECILATPGFFATFEPSGGYIVAAFVRREDGVHQVIAPYAQFVVGLGDPSTWDPGQGSEGDPGLVPGGFVDQAGPWTPRTSAGEIMFTGADYALTKTYSLTETGLRVEYESIYPVTVKISFGLDPWRMYSAGWGGAYRGAAIPAGWEWAIEGGLQVDIISSGAVTANAFTASQMLLAGSEDPNFAYPPGHYIPFPLALVEIYGQGEFYIQLDIR